MPRGTWATHSLTHSLRGRENNALFSSTTQNQNKKNKKQVVHKKKEGLYLNKPKEIKRREREREREVFNLLREGSKVQP
jgi:hypothetical protein